ncbi:hypothetical protein ACLIKE_00510 [Ferroplasma acidiphilum]|jgi:hypothetical protein|uniref:Uncharacterized protein n=1 Tax=Ferroplasma acidiphilum TaxID=74969 RepID=A0A7K4FN18_9ARCH|nr:hypothetical protein [Ferroplasma acidiphilum]NOL60430.1 hypothetical protein [Ferroplasma acidiphilum]
MPVDKQQFESSGTNSIGATVLEFLEKNTVNAYTLKEIDEHIAKNHDNLIIHMELTFLVWSDKIEYRDIYNQDGKLVRYFRFKESKK